MITLQQEQIIKTVTKWIKPILIGVLGFLVEVKKIKTAI
jgi:type II secretory pathway component PulF